MRDETTDGEVARSDHDAEAGDTLAPVFPVSLDAAFAEALAAHVATLIASPAAWAAASAGVRRVAAPDAAGAVVRACESVLAARQTMGPRRDAR